MGTGFMTTEALYPYTGRQGPTCRLPRNPGPGNKTELAQPGFVQLQPWSPAALRAAVLEQPVVVGIEATVLFPYYSGGVWLPSECGPYATGAGGLPVVNSISLNHALLVIGFNMKAKPPYWIVKNSWGDGAEWGDNGYGFIEMVTRENSTGTCGMYAWMLKPTAPLNTTAPPGRGGIFNFTFPKYNELPMDTCLKWGGIGCGQPAADQFCRLQASAFAEASAPL
ncbi:hypothetical protein ABPG75_006667 [Micractinium tetrahymenae]